jgi:hypothetical protein
MGVSGDGGVQIQSLGFTNEVNARFMFGYSGFLEWGPGGTGDQDISLSRNGPGDITIQNFWTQGVSTPAPSFRAFRVSMPQENSPTSQELPLFSVDTENRAVRVALGASGFFLSDSFRIVRAVKTTDATATTLFSLALIDGRSYHITAKVVGRKSDGSERVFFYQAVLAYRQGGGAVIQVDGGSPIVRNVIDPIKSSGTGTWNCTIDASGDDIRVRVTGASLTVNWVATIEYQSVSTDA